METKPETNEDWLASLPPQVAAVAKQYPQEGCYRYDGGHYTILQYDEDRATGTVTLHLVHGSDSFAPGISVFDIDPADVTPCNCGKWQPPTQEQREATRIKGIFFKLNYMFEHRDEMTLKQKRDHVKHLAAQVRVAMKI